MDLEKNQGQAPSGVQMVLFVKKHGVPYPLIIRILREKGLRVSKTDYEKALTDWKHLSVTRGK